MKNLVLLLCLVLFSTNGFSQLDDQFFTNPVEGFSKKKTAYITLTNGDELQGTIKKLKRTKGLFDEIRLTLENGKLEKIDATDIKFMYLPQSNWDKIVDGADFVGNARRWTTDLNEEHLKDGYAYFEQTKVNYRKKKVENLLLQLLNPSFTNVLKVYHDPLAAETMSVGLAGVALVGGDDKSYFVKKGDAVAYRLKKKNMSDYEAQIFDDCADAYKEIVEDKLYWGVFAKLLYEYSLACE